MSTSPAAPAAPSTPPKAAKSGGYVVLKRVSTSPDTWVPVITSSASNAAAAIRDEVAKLAAGDQSGTFVAIPARSWRPQKVTPNTVTKLVVEDVKP